MKESDIEQWMVICIDIAPNYPDGRTNHSAAKTVHRYDIPRRMYDKWKWVFNWRLAWYQCQYPRNYVSKSYSFYDKKTGLEMGYGKALTKLISMKGQVTRNRNKLERARKIHNQKYGLFNDFESSEEYKKLMGKISHYESEVSKYSEEVEKLKNESTPQ